MKRFATATLLLTASISPAFAETIEVEMLNKNEAGDRMVFSQELIRADVGDHLSNADQILDARIPGKGGEKIAALVEEVRSTIAAETEEPKGNS